MRHVWKNGLIDSEMVQTNKGEYEGLLCQPGKYVLKLQ